MFIGDSRGARCLLDTVVFPAIRVVDVGIIQICFKGLQLIYEGLYLTGSDMSLEEQWS